MAQKKDADAEANVNEPIEETNKDAKKRSRVSQTDVPSFSLTEAIRVPKAVHEYGSTSVKPLRVAEALDLSITSSTFKMLCGAAIAYGLTEGGYRANLISITPLGRRIVAPREEGDDQAALREAALKPRVISEFLNMYNQKRLPAENIAHNVLEDLGVPRDRVSRTLELILETAQDLGFVREIKGHRHVDLDSSSVTTPGGGRQEEDLIEDEGASSVEPSEPSFFGESRSSDSGTRDSQSGSQPTENNRVFVTHGKNKEIVEQLKDLLLYGKYEPIVSVERETVSKPVPDKVLDDMRTCFAAIIHVGTEMTLMDQAGQEHKMLNSNVLIEIGAAMALYGGQFILLVEEGTTLPSNLQGLYQVRYKGETLDFQSAMKLLKAFNDFRT